MSETSDTLPEASERMGLLRQLPGRLVVTIAVGYVAPMIAMWWLGPAVGWLADTHGVPSGGGWSFRRLGGIIPYPYPFTGRAALALALICVPPLVFGALWLWARKRSTGIRASAR